MLLLPQSIAHQYSFVPYLKVESTHSQQAIQVPHIDLFSLKYHRKRVKMKIVYGAVMLCAVEDEFLFLHKNMVMYCDVKRDMIFVK